MNEKLIEQVKYIQNNFDDEHYQMWCDGDMKVVNERLLKTNIGPTHDDLYFPGDVNETYDPAEERKKMFDN